MLRRIVFSGFVVLLAVGVARADCLVIQSDDCVEFSSLFGYEPVACGSEECDPTMEGFECENIDTEYKYFDNEADYYYSSTTETGSTAIDTVTGDACIKKRVCDDCTDDTFPYIPDCKSTLSWSTFLWGSTITYSGSICN